MAYMSPLKLLSTPKKPRLGTDWDKCIICQDVSKERLINSTSSGVSSLQVAADKRQDTVHSRIKSDESNVVTMKYHKICFSSYTSKTNILHHKQEENVTIQDESTPSTVRRSPSTVTDLKLCIVCQKKSKKMPLHKLQSKACEESLRISAEQRCDEAMLRKIRGEDLIALGVVYHSKCMSTYVSAYHIARMVKNKSTPTESKNDDDESNAFSNLIEHINKDLMKGRVFELSSLLQMFISYLPDTDQQATFHSHHLQRKLKQHYGDSVIIQTQKGQGKSSLIMSADITLSDAVKVADNLKKELRDRSISLTGSYHDDYPNEDTFEEKFQILHHAISILRKEIDDMEITDDYPLASDISLDSSADFVPKLLYQAMLWLVDKESYIAATHEHAPSDDAKRKALSLAECAIYANRKTCTPLHLGLAAQMHHDYGKRGIIDTLHSLGFSLGYDELRRFNTALAQDEIRKMQSGIYVPAAIISSEQGGALVHEGDDNIDINTETVDGKNTFHSMARVVFQDQPISAHPVTEKARLQRNRSKSLCIPTEKTHGLTKVSAYAKPKQRPEPPKCVDPIARLESCKLEEHSLRDLSWILLRQVCREILPLPSMSEESPSQTIPFWTGFNAHLSEMNDSHTVAAYKPMIDAPPADMSTLYTTMKECSEMSKQLGQECAVQTMDQQLYALAQQVKWSRLDEFSMHIIRLGGFHTMSCYIAAIGKLWGGGGLKDMLVDSQVYPSCTADQMLSGKQFHRAVRGLTLVFESMMHVFMLAFLQWCNETKQSIPDSIFEKLCQVLSDPTSELTPQDLEASLAMSFVPIMDDFKAWGCAKSPTFQFWNQFLDAVLLLLQNIRAERQSDWAGHLDSLTRMLPYFFVTQRVNYSRWLPVYLLDMLQLPESIHSAFVKGEFTVKSQGRFNGLWSDMGTESTVIKDAKGDGGIIGLTRKEGAMVRWSLTRHMLAEYAFAIRERSGATHTGIHTLHEQAQPSRMTQDEKHVQCLITHIQENMTNPFAVENHPDGVLINIATGLHASKEVQKSLLEANETGKSKMESFLKHSLSEGGAGSLYSPISKSSLVTFTDMTKKVKVSAKGNKMNVSVSPEIVFRRALTMSRRRDDVNMDTVLSHPVTPIPIALFHEDGTMRKCQKSELVKKIEEQVQSKDGFEEGDISCTVYIRDSMAEVQMMQGDKYKTFAELAHAYLSMLVNGFQRANTVVDVFDRYDHDESVKSGERERRRISRDTMSRQYQVLAGRSVPPWRKFLNLSENKAALANFICQYVVEYGPNHHMLVNHPERKIYMAGGFTDGKIVKAVSCNGVVDMEQLFSTHEEADTRILLHAMHSNTVFDEGNMKGRVIIKTADTDVIVLAIHYMPMMHATKEMWIETGRITTTTDRRRYIPIHDVWKEYGDGICQILPAAHALTGCDSVSSFFGIGKKSVMKALIDKGSDYFKGLFALSTPDEMKAVESARVLISYLYDSKGKQQQYHDNLNALRVHLAYAKEAELLKLPPCESSFLQHVKRASWQTKVWLSSHIAQPNLPSPNGHGWHMREENLVPFFNDGPAAAELLQDLLCTCSGRSACRFDCECNTNGLPCTDICPCFSEGCRNPYTDITRETVDLD